MENQIEKPLKILLLILLSLATLSTTAWAHKVIVFAWIEQGRIHVEGSFGSNRPAKKCVINVKDPKGRVVHQGITDSLGQYSFKLPNNLDSDLVVELNAGTGHLGRWTLPREELVREPSPENLEKKMAEKESVEKSPSPARISAGIAVIFGLAFAAAWLKRRKRDARNA